MSLNFFLLTGSECPLCGRKDSFFPKAPVPDTTSLVWYCVKCGYEQEIEGVEDDTVSVFDRIQPLVSTEDGEWFDLSFNTDEVSYQILELSYKDITELVAEIIMQLDGLVEAVERVKNVRKKV